MGKREDQIFANVAIENYFIQKKQAIECVQQLKAMEEAGETLPSLADLLIEKGYLTSIQKDVVLRMMEAQSPGASQPKASDSPPKQDAVKSKPKPAPVKHQTKKNFSPRDLGGYELLEPIGEGQMGMVYKARQKSMDRFVAVKILSARLAKDEDFRKRFLSEARATAKLNHNNIVAGIDVGEIEGEYCFVMEYIDGPSIQTKLQKGGAFDERQSLEIVLQIAKGLEHASKHNMLHRDIKPDNIMMTKSGIAKLCDLGLASRQGGDEDKGKTVGTPNYISPEQALGKESIDIRSDIYSLGTTLFHMLAGKLPFEGTPAVVMTKHLNDKPPSLFDLVPNIKRGTVQIVEKMLEKEPDNRYQSPKELIEDIERVLEGGLPVQGSANATSSPAGKGPKLREVSRSRGLPGRRPSGVIRRGPASGVKKTGASPNTSSTTSPAKPTTPKKASSSKAKSMRSLRKRRSRF